MNKTDADIARYLDAYVPLSGVEPIPWETVSRDARRVATDRRYLPSFLANLVKWQNSRRWRVTVIVVGFGLIVALPASCVVGGVRCQRDACAATAPIGRERP